MFLFFTMQKLLPSAEGYLKPFVQPLAICAEKPHDLD